MRPNLAGALSAGRRRCIQKQKPKLQQGSPQHKVYMANQLQNLSPPHVGIPAPWDIKQAQHHS
eukprot:1139009-Pelagomonas_calceolata.AAC.3